MTPPPSSPPPAPPSRKGAKPKSARGRKRASRPDAPHERAPRSGRPPAGAGGGGGDGTRKRRDGPNSGGGAVRWTLTALGVMLAVASFAMFITYPASRGPGSGKAVDLSIDGTETPDTLARKLSDAGLITSPRLFAFYTRVTGGTGALVKGPHVLSDDASPRELLARLERLPGGGHVRVTFPEGWNRFDMARRLQEKKVVPLRPFLDATTDRALLDELHIEGESADGYLFPATYDLPLDSAPADVIRRMKDEFDRRWAALEQRHASSLLDLAGALKFGAREVVILASMIEKEAVLDEERPIIASVFLNRLRDPEFRPKYLQCDPTAGYGCVNKPELAPSCSAYAGKITPAINNDGANPYSTYRHEGLPPGPICNPGARSLEAAMSPASTRFLYFVAKGEGRHTFSESYGAHTAAIREGRDAGAKH